MESPQNAEVNQEKPLAEQIRIALENSKDWKPIGYERKLKQKEILDNLPADLEGQIKKIASTSRPEELRGRIAGESFEQIVRSDKNICPEAETPEARIVRSIMKDPSEYRLDLYGITEGVRVLDFAHMNQDEQFDRATEVKATQVDPRVIDQLKKFKENLIRVVNILEDLKSKDNQILLDRGLKEIANNPKKMEVAENFAITLAVPHGTYQGVSGLLIDEESFDHDNDEIEDAVETLETCTIIESQFSRKDLGTITNCVMDWLQKEMPEIVPQEL